MLSDGWIDVSSQANRLFRRCVVCPDGPQNLLCPACGSKEVCTQRSQTCDECVSLVCLPISQSGSTATGSSNSSSSGPSIGAIVGGVVGGVIALAIISFLIWKFGFKKSANRRKKAEKEGDEFTANRNARASTHTVASLASTVFTRASNIIQIAYIPGLNSRASTVPPVPPVPTMAGGQSYYDDSGAPRGSALSDYHGGRDSLRTVYGGDTATPVTKILRGRAAVVSVYPNGPSGGGSGLTSATGSTRPNKASKLGRFVTGAQVVEIGSSDPSSPVSSNGPIELPANSTNNSTRLEGVPMHVAELYGTPVTSKQTSRAGSCKSPEATELQGSVGKSALELSVISEVTVDKLSATGSAGKDDQGRGSPFSDENRVN